MGSDRWKSSALTLALRSMTGKQPPSRSKTKLCGDKTKLNTAPAHEHSSTLHFPQLTTSLVRSCTETSAVYQPNKSPRKQNHTFLFHRGHDLIHIHQVHQRRCLISPRNVFLDLTIKRNCVLFSATVCAYWANTHDLLEILESGINEVYSKQGKPNIQYYDYINCTISCINVC